MSEKKMLHQTSGDDKSTEVRLDDFECGDFNDSPLKDLEFVGTQGTLIFSAASPVLLSGFNFPDTPLEMDKQVDLEWGWGGLQYIVNPETIPQVAKESEPLQESTKFYMRGTGYITLSEKLCDRLGWVETEDEDGDKFSKLDKKSEAELALFIIAQIISGVTSAQSHKPTMVLSFCAYSHVPGLGTPCIYFNLTSSVPESHWLTTFALKSKEMKVALETYKDLFTGELRKLIDEDGGLEGLLDSNRVLN